MDPRRVVVTGLGALTPIGNTADEFWSALKQARSGVGPITRFDANVKSAQGEFLYPTRIAGEVRHFDPLKYVDKKEARRLDLFLQYAMACSVMAVEDAAVVTACATGNHAIGDARRLIQRGDADIMIAGGAEAIIIPLTIAGFCAMKAMSTRNDEPGKASRPFDAERDGFVCGEGGGVLVLEALDHAVRRDARIYAEIIGYGLTGDAHHMTAPDPEGDGAARAMAAALADARLGASDVGYINAHGTSTVYNDRFETLAIKRVFGEHARRVAVSSTKSMTGHLLGAAGGVEAIATVLALHHGVLPPTINYETPDPDCDLDYVPNQ